MGYRSEVIFGVRKDSRDKMDKVLEEHDLQNSFKWYEKTHTWTKYDEYEDVRAINECIDELEGKGFMVALGEDNVIHSERGEWYDYVEHICKLKIK